MQSRKEIEATEQHIRRWISTGEFCARYGVSPQTARRWCRQGRLKFVRVPPRPHARLLILDPEWIQLDAVTPGDPSEWLTVLRQCDVARLLAVTPRALRYMEAAGRARYRLVGHRKLYSLGEVRRLLAQRQNKRENVTRRERREGLLGWATSRLNLPVIESGRD